MLFGLFAGAFYACTAVPWFRSDFFPWYLGANAHLANAILRMMGEDTVMSGSSITSPRFGLTIQRGCDAIEPIALLVAAVLAFPAPRRSKFAAVLAGTALLLGLNLVRIVSLYFTGVWFPRFFETMHVDVWQALFIVIAMILWLAWAWRVVHAQRAGSHARA